MFDSLTQLEPVNLSRHFAMLPGCNNEQIGSPSSLSSTSIDEKFISDIEDEEEQEEEDGNQVEQKAIELLDQLKETMPSYGLKLKADKLLLEFFTEKIVDLKKHRAGYSFEEEVLEEAEHWINELKHNDLLVDWEVQKNRQAYIRDMEKGGEWKTLGKENEELALELEIQVFTALLDDLLLDIS